MTAKGEPAPTPAVASRPNKDSEQSEAGDTAPARSHGAAATERDRLTRLFATLGKLLGVVVTVVTLIGGTVTLLFQIDPSVVPCIGGGGATFTSVQVVPDYPLAQYFRDINHGQTPEGLPSIIGAEIRYSYSTSNLSGNGVRLYATLQEILPNGDVTAAPGPPAGPTSAEDLQRQVGLPTQPPPVMTPNKCSQDSSGLDWIEVPKGQRRGRYRVVLEFYRGALNTFTDRVGVGESPIFDY